MTRESSSLSSRTIFNQKDFYEGINRIYPRVGNHTKNSDSVLNIEAKVSKDYKRRRRQLLSRVLEKGKYLLG